MEHIYRKKVPQESENEGGVKYVRFKGGGQMGLRIIRVYVLRIISIKGLGIIQV